MGESERRLDVARARYADLVLQYEEDLAATREQAAEKLSWRRPRANALRPRRPCRSAEPRCGRQHGARPRREEK